MGNHESQNGTDLVLDYWTQKKKAEMDRRQFLLRAVAAGATAPAIASGLRTRGARAAAQGDAATLVTVSQEQQQSWIRNFNPLLSESQVRWPTHCGIYEPLLIFNVATGETVPWLATGWSFSEDNLTLTFTIREGVNWSDGTPFTARDVAFTFNLLKSNDALPGSSGGAKAVLPLTSSIEAPDDKTVVITFTEVFTPGLWDLGEAIIAPEHIFSTVEDPVTFTNENPVGTGPFTEIGTFEAQYWELHKNPNYWQEGKPHVQGFRFPSYPSNDAANLATLNGENDWAGNFIPEIENEYVAKDPEHHHYWFPSTGDEVMLYVNTTKAPFDNPDVRKAISMAINREQIVDIAMYGYTHVPDATGLSDAYETWKSADAVAAGAELVTLNVEKANELLDAAGLVRDGDVRRLPDESEMSYDINVVTGWSDWVTAVQIIADNLKEVGINLTVQPYDFAAWIERVQQGNFDVSIGWSAGGPTPYNYYRGQMSSLTRREIGQTANENWHRYASDQADTLLAQFASTSDEAEQREIANQLQMLFVQEFPAIPLFPGPQWGEYNSTRFTDFPDENNPYSLLSTYAYTERLITMTTIKPVAG